MICSIVQLEKLYSDDKPESKTTMNSFVNNDYKKTEAILNILLHGVIDFIIYNGRYQFSKTSVKTLNFLLNKHFDNEDMDYNDELMERFNPNGSSLFSLLLKVFNIDLIKLKVVQWNTCKG